MAWGDNGKGQTTVPTGTDFIAIAAGKNHNIAIQSEGDSLSGSLVAWGEDEYSQVSNIPDGNDFVAVAAGTVHSLALRADGTLEAWGAEPGSVLDPDYNQVTDTPTDDGYIAIAAGAYHNVAMKSDGTIAAWGRDNKGQATASDDTNFIAIAAGGYHSLAIEAEDKAIPPDFNADLMTDVLWQRVSTGNYLSQLMSEVAGKPTLDKSPSAISGIWGNPGWKLVDLGDFNGDGKSDVLRREIATGRHIVQLKDGGYVEFEGAAGWLIVDTADFDGDGICDVLWRRTTNPVYAAQLVEEGMILGDTVFLGGSLDQQIVDLGDFNGDGLCDVLWYWDSTKKFSAQLMKRDESMNLKLDNTKTLLLVGSADWEVTHLGDFDGDGNCDVLLRRNIPTGGYVVQLITDEFTLGTTKFVGGNGDWQIKGIGDFNADTIADLLWRRDTTDAYVAQLMTDSLTLGQAGYLGGTAEWQIIFP